jgi:hypothetical protein
MPPPLLLAVLNALAFTTKAGVLAWATLATLYSPVPHGGVRAALALAFFALGLAALFIRPSKTGFRVFAAATLVTTAAWSLKQPSHDRDWITDLSKLPTASINGDRVTLHQVRDFDHHSKTQATPRWIERSVLLSELESVDLFVSHWGSDLVAHTFVSFNFTNAEPICISIEARHEKGESYSPVASCFKESELIYVVGSERDLVGSRTLFRGEEVYLYRINAGPIGLRRLFLTYLERLNRLSRQPEFYHLLSNNCTVNIRNHAAGSNDNAFDLRVLLNGLVAAHVYDLGLIDTSLPFRELRGLSRINQAAVDAAGSPDFSDKIRRHLNHYQP